MTLPIHTVGHIRSDYRKYQIIAFLFTLITLTAALLAAVSGIRIMSLQKQQTAEADQMQAQSAVQDESLNKQIDALKSELANEMSAAQKLKEIIAEKNRQLAAIKKTLTAPPSPDAATPLPVPENTPPASAVPQKKATMQPPVEKAPVPSQSSDTIKQQPAPATPIKQPDTPHPVKPQVQPPVPPQSRTSEPVPPPSKPDAQSPTDDPASTEPPPAPAKPAVASNPTQPTVTPTPASTPKTETLSTEEITPTPSQEKP